jgi:hypothetical protein
MYGGTRRSRRSKRSKIRCASQMADINGFTEEHTYMKGQN